MMQKNLSCRNLDREPEEHALDEYFFVAGQPALPGTGALLYIFLEQSGTGHAVFGPDCQIAIGDDCIRKIHSLLLFPLRYSPVWMGIVFLLGLTAAAYSSADSALTALTTSFASIYFNTKNILYR